MNWWPWQTWQAPTRVATNTNVSYEPTLPVGGMNHADLDRYLLGQPQAEHVRNPGPGDIEFYRNRARSAEAEAKKLRDALMEIATGEYSDATQKSEWSSPTMMWEAAALLALGHPDKGPAMRPLTPHEDNLIREALRASSEPA